jgi:hypothetical protein
MRKKKSSESAPSFTQDAHRSSKNQRVFIELHDYSFYHGPSEIEQSDRRFIGRERLIERFRTVLTETSKKAGTYLVAGYRGMGKTSFVNKVLERIYTPSRLRRSLFMWAFLMALFALVTMGVTYLAGLPEAADVARKKELIVNLKWASFIVMIIVWGFIILLSFKQGKRWRLYRAFVEEGLNVQNLHYRAYLGFVGLYFATLFVVLWFLKSKGMGIRLFDNLPGCQPDRSAPLVHMKMITAIYTTFFFILMSWELGIEFWRTCQAVRSEASGRSFWERIGYKFTSFINYSQRINIKLNLGYSDLREIDVLRLIARNIRTRYRQYRQSLSVSLIIRLFIIVSAYLMVKTLFERDKILGLHETMKNHTGFTELFPSQRKLLIRNEKNLLIPMVEALKKDGSMTMNDYRACIRMLDETFPATVQCDDVITREVADWDRIKNTDTASSSVGKEMVLSVVNQADYVIYCSYHYFRQVIPVRAGWLLPKSMDYLFVVCVVVFIFLIGYLSSLLNYRYLSLRQIKRKINFLNDLIDANLTMRTEGSMNLKNSPFILGRSRSMEYRQVDEREIEKYLIEIIEDLAFRPIYSFRAQFVFVFDELDKIEPRFTPSEQNREKPREHTTDSNRNRQRTILELLSNLKYFLSTAQAKFIFITGREMYDAALADISDRNFRIGSIFHDTFYLNSFFTDLTYFGCDDITSRTEQFVCQFLFPYDYKQKRRKKLKKLDQKLTLNLKEYHRYLADKVEGFKEKNLVAQQKREKVIYLLQQFIIYLNHVSTGAPSKLTSYFENYVISRHAVQNFKEGLIAGSNKSANLFLFFDYHQQYKLGVINYLLTPFNFTVNRNIRNYSDKLIVSASFLHDHLLKYHRNAFSWRDLEATPEMVDVHKNADLRDFFINVIQYMQDTQIQRIINGLYDFKFPKRVAHEISFLSDISDDASASFNFTLDESQSLKQHYKDQYQKLRQNHEGLNPAEGDYIYSLASLSLTLADLCFYDEDLGEAITHYLEAIQPLRSTDKAFTPTQLALFTRNMLKLGHALEKRHTYDNAFITYTEITRMLLAKIAEEQKRNEAWIIDLLANVRSFYQPFLAKLYIIEKVSFNGIRSHDLEKSNRDFYRLLMLIPKNSQHHLRAEYDNKVGDILYYKNEYFPDHCQSGTCPLTDDPALNCECAAATACAYYTRGMEHLVKNLNAMHNGINIESFDVTNLEHFFEKLKEAASRFSVDEYLALAMHLSDIGDTLLCCPKVHKIEPEDSLKSNLEKIQQYFEIAATFYRKAGDHKNFAYQYIKQLYIMREVAALKLTGTIKSDYLKDEQIEATSKMALSGIYCAYEQIHAYEISRFKDILNPHPGTDGPDRLSTNDIALNRISLSTEIDEVWVLTEEIRLLRDGVKENARNQVNRLVNPYTMNTNMYNRFLKLRLKALSNESLFDEVTGEKIDRSKDVACIFRSIIDFFRMDERDNEHSVHGLEFSLIDTIFCYFEIIKILNTFDNSFSLNHSLQCEMHEKLYEWSKVYNAYLLFYDALQLTKPNEEKALRELLKPYSLEDTIQALKDILGNKVQPTRISDRLGRLIEPDNLPFIVPFYQGEKAVREYYAAVETHSQGRSYRYLIEKMYYLNDDFNDRLFHFSIALERFKLNVQNSNEKIFEKRINKMKEELKESRCYKIDSYIPKIEESQGPGA